MAYTRALFVFALACFKAAEVSAFCNGANEWLCSSGRQCIFATYVCDGNYECIDGSDEFGCSTTDEEPCGRNGFACSSGSPRCINKEFKYCNGYGDCSDNSDEMCTSGPQSDDGIGVALGLIIGIPVAIVGSIPLCVLGVACIVTTYKYGIRLYRRRSTDYSTNVQTPSKHPMVVTTSMEESESKGDMLQPAPYPSAPGYGEQPMLQSPPSYPTVHT